MWNDGKYKFLILFHYVPDHGFTEYLYCLYFFVRKKTSFTNVIIGNSFGILGNLLLFLDNSITHPVSMAISFWFGITYYLLSCFTLLFTYMFGKNFHKKESIGVFSFLILFLAGHFIYYLTNWKNLTYYYNYDNHFYL